ncbi:phytanoyl-CoA dioxygenase family protein [Pseudoroseicyclus tamaricis]|uniref:Phytanoyl-CoA dioxygenase family protein n=1 Tax=Pseudoroseicyclus tamaricis TaxID=2705421 RepID=A0A6B2JPY5_9RHOB|nr:phytanoyl-CoA dioxygenase family protein [Pseudoroseicyclus tamaricis]NDV00178.1 phytanoyl-CoA dioxygenase family protein [Pseudoroseicyclus tamaricis]
MTDRQDQSAQRQLDDYLFDLQGYLILRGALSGEELAEANRDYDTLQRDRAHPGGPVVVSDPGRQEGLMFQQLYEMGGVWERMLDHPSWFDHCLHYIGTDDPDNFDGHHGPAFIDECFGTIRGPGGAQRLHSGGEKGTIRTQYRYHAGKFHCGQVNVLIALNDIGPGDGATVVVPGSHKSNLRHPQTVPRERYGEELSADDTAGGIEAHLKAGDALLFVDAIMHGSARRTNEGERRVCVYRYGPSWGYFRHKWRPSDGLMARLSPDRRKLVNPHA